MTDDSQLPIGTRMEKCCHPSLSCVNGFELIRKYRCTTCGAIMICGCEEAFARTYLPHQTSEAVHRDTQARLRVTGGFQPGVCRSCRGLPEEPFPKSPTFGRTTKIVRYYWREIQFETIPKFAEWAAAEGHKDWLDALIDHQAKYHELEKSVIAGMKDLHARSPKYDFAEPSQADIIDRFKVEVVSLNADYVECAEKGKTILRGGEAISVEDFVIEHFKTQGLDAIKIESQPVHALFAIFMWVIYLDPDDELLRPIMFGERGAYERGEKKDVHMLSPRDFGTAGYTSRRAEALRAWFDWLLGNGAHLTAIFNQSIGGSWQLRNKLWAHRDELIPLARRLVELCPAEDIVSILEYLVGNYHERHLGWPDLLVFGKGRPMWIEVKGSSDKLSQDQKRWIRGNSELMHLPFKIVKVHRNSSSTPVR